MKSETASFELECAIEAADTTNNAPAGSGFVSPVAELSRTVMTRRAANAAHIFRYQSR
jgi:hypothetical protein